MEIKSWITEHPLVLFFIWLITLGILLWLATQPTSAAVLVYGPNYNYSEVVLPNASYVHQGENISQGNYYDLFGIYGFSGKVAHWKNSDDVGYETPDTIVTLEDNPHHLTYISPSVFPVGEWYQWDGANCDKESGWCTSGFGHGNNYVFAVVPSETVIKTHSETIIKTKNITITGEDGNSVEVQVTVQETIQVKDPAVDVLAGNVTTIVVPTTSIPATTPPTPVPTLLLPNSDHTPVPTTLQVVTPKADMEYVPALIFGALIIAGIWRKRDGI